MPDDKRDETLRELSRHSGIRGASPQDKLLLKAVDQAEERVLFSPYYNERVGRELFPYQAAGVAFFLSQPRRQRGAGGPPLRAAGIFDSMGLGKTNQGLGILLALTRDDEEKRKRGKPSGGLPALVVCPASALSAWRRDLAALTVLTPVTVSSLDDLEAVGEGSSVALMTYSKLSSWGAAAVRERLPRRLSLIIFDEAHYLKNPDSGRSRAASALIGVAENVVLLTGTPALSSALEALPLLTILEGRQPPLRTIQDRRRQEIEFEAGPPPRELFKAASGKYDVVLPEDAGGIEGRLRTVAVRRSRRSIKRASQREEQRIGRKPAWGAFLQPFKQRSVLKVPVPRHSGYGEVVAEELQSLAASGGEVPRGLPTFAQLRTSIRNYRTLLRDHVIQALTQGGPVPTVQSLDSWGSQQRQGKNLIKDARRAYLPVPRRVQYCMGQFLLPHAVDLQGKHLGETMVFALSSPVTARDLAQKLSEAAPGRRVFLYTGQASFPAVFVDGVGRGRRKDLGDRDDPFARVAPLFALKDVEIDGESARVPVDPTPKTLVMTRAAAEGLGLPSANMLVFVSRFTSPGIEEQIEDRINRVGRVGQARIVYLLPEGPFAYGLSHRMENRRRSLFALVGEKAGDDNAEPLRVNPADEEDTTTYDCGRTSGRAAVTDDELARAKADVLGTYRIIEDPKKARRDIAAGILSPESLAVIRQVVGATAAAATSAIDAEDTRILGALAAKRELSFNYQTKLGARRQFSVKAFGAKRGFYNGTVRVTKPSEADRLIGREAIGQDKTFLFSRLKGATLLQQLKSLGTPGPRHRRNPAQQPGKKLQVLPRWYQTGPAMFTAELLNAGVLNRELREGRPEAMAMGEARLGLMQVDVSGLGCHNPVTGAKGAEILWVGADSGWGPLLYDFAALVSTNVFGMPLVSDRTSVSEDAEAVWGFYAYKRPDVPKVDLKREWQCFPTSEGEGEPPLFGITMPLPVFNKAWGVDGQFWLDNAKYKWWEANVKRGKKSPLGMAKKNPPETIDSLERAAEKVETMAQAQRLYLKLGVFLSRRQGKPLRQEAKEIRRKLERRFGQNVRGRTATTYKAWDPRAKKTVWVVAPSEMRRHITVPKGSLRVSTKGEVVPSISGPAIPLLPVIYDPATGEPIAVYDQPGVLSAALIDLVHRYPSMREAVKAEIVKAATDYRDYERKMGKT